MSYWQFLRTSNLALAIACAISLNFAALAAEPGDKPAATRADMKALAEDLRRMTEELKATSEEFKAFSELTKQAENGCTECQRKVGVAFLVGDPISQDLKKARMWLEKAADGGDAAATTALGAGYEVGAWGKIDLKKAWNYYSRGLMTSNLWAEYYAGIAIQNGDGVKKNLKEALRLLTLAAEKGNRGAQLNLGKTYEYGKGVKKDHKKACEYVLKSAEQGYSQAESYLSRLYFDDGQKEECIKWTQRAAEHGDAFALTFLGLLYSNGELSFKKDPVEGYKYYYLAVQRGDRLGNAKAELAKAAKEPGNKEALAEARIRASKFKFAKEKPEFVD